MLSSCANQSCGQPLASLKEGRLFQFQIVSISVSADDREKMEYDEVPNRLTTNFWLCGACAATMKLVLTPFEGVRLISQEDSMAQPVDDAIERTMIERTMIDRTRIDRTMNRSIDQSHRGAFRTPLETHQN
jgi:hypothetical protein